MSQQSNKLSNAVAPAFFLIMSILLPILAGKESWQVVVPMHIGECSVSGSVCCSARAVYSACCSVLQCVAVLMPILAGEDSWQAVVPMNISACMICSVLQCVVV